MYQYREYTPRMDGEESYEIVSTYERLPLDEARTLVSTSPQRKVAFDAAEELGIIQGIAI